MESHTLGSGDGEQGSDGERKPAQMQLQNNYSRDVYVEAPYAVKTEGNNKSYLSHSDSAHARISGEGVQRIHGIGQKPHPISDIELGHCDFSGIKVEGIGGVNSHPSRVMNYHSQTHTEFHGHGQYKQSGSTRNRHHHQHDSFGTAFYGQRGGHVNNNRMYHQNQIQAMQNTTMLPLPPGVSQNRHNYHHPHVHPPCYERSIPPRVYYNHYHPFHLHPQSQEYIASPPMNNHGNQHHYNQYSANETWQSHNDRYYSTSSSPPAHFHFPNTQATMMSTMQMQSSDVHHHQGHSSNRVRARSPHQSRQQCVPPPSPTSLRQSKLQRRVNDHARMTSADAASGVIDARRSQHLSSMELQQMMPEDFPGCMEFELVACEVVPNGEDVGCMKDFNQHEVEVVYGKDGMVRKFLPLAKKSYTNKENHAKGGQESGTRYLGFHCERKRMLKCRVPNCPVEAKVCRVQYGDTKGILYYEKKDPNTKERYQHFNHDSHSGKQ